MNHIILDDWDDDLLMKYNALIVSVVKHTYTMAV